MRYGYKDNNEYTEITYNTFPVIGRDHEWQQDIRYPMDFMSHADKDKGREYNI